MVDLNLIEKYGNDKRLQYAFKEFKLAGYIDENGNAIDSYAFTICSDTCDILLLICKQNHLNTTYKQVLHLVRKLSDYMPITPLKGTDDEWNEFNDVSGHKQNKRCGHIFKDCTGFTYDSNGRVFHAKGDPLYFSSLCSNKFIEFPYSPPDTPEVYELDENGLTRELKDKLIKEEYQKWIDSGK